MNRETIDPVADFVYIPIRKHRELIEEYFFNMYTKYQEILCPGGYFCLQGVYTDTDPSDLTTTPYTCPGGSYCMPGSGTVIGTGFCPAGNFCP